jgi:hypothetical protein
MSPTNTKRSCSEGRGQGVSAARRHFLRSLCAPFGVVMGGCGEERDYWPSVPFSPEKWKQTPGIGRFVFVNDLIRSKILLGMSRDAVFALLGKPSHESVVPYDLIYVVKAGSSAPFGFNQVFALKIGLHGAKGEVATVVVIGD